MGSVLQLKTDQKKSALSYSNKKTLKRYITLINDRTLVWTKSDILGFKKLMSNGMNQWVEPEYSDAILSLWRAYSAEFRERCITKEQSDFGIEWLQKTLFKLNGEPRQNKTTENFYPRHFEIVRDFLEFSFIGYHFEYYNRAQISGPVYRVYDRNGNYFDYCVAGRWGKVLIDHEIRLNDY